MKSGELTPDVEQRLVPTAPFAIGALGRHQRGQERQRLDALCPEDWGKQHQAHPAQSARLPGSIGRVGACERIAAALEEIDRVAGDDADVEARPRAGVLPIPRPGGEAGHQVNGFELRMGDQTLAHSAKGCRRASRCRHRSLDREQAMNVDWITPRATRLAG